MSDLLLHSLAHLLHSLISWLTHYVALLMNFPSSDFSVNFVTVSYWWWILHTGISIYSSSVLIMLTGLLHIIFPNHWLMKWNFVSRSKSILRIKFKCRPLLHKCRHHHNNSSSSNLEEGHHIYSRSRVSLIIGKNTHTQKKNKIRLHHKGSESVKISGTNQTHTQKYTYKTHTKKNKYTESVFWKENV